MATTERHHVEDQQFDAATEKLRDRHVEKLSRLMRTRSDLRGVYGFADMVDDAIRWSA